MPARSSAPVFHVGSDRVGPPVSAMVCRATRADTEVRPYNARANGA